MKVSTVLKVLTEGFNGFGGYACISLSNTSSCHLPWQSAALCKQLPPTCPSVA